MYNWKEICEQLKINEMVLRRWRSRVGYINPKYRVNNHELDDAIRFFIREHDGRGEAYILGYLRHRRIDVTRGRVRASIRRIDPNGILLRKLKRLKRVRYQVDGPFALWHIDGCHKLIRWGIVIHGCIDGFTRCIMYMLLIIIDHQRYWVAFKECLFIPVQVN